MNENRKSYCDVCDCLVVTLGHESRCAPKRVTGWPLERVKAWFGDTVHRLDLQFVISRLYSDPKLWEAAVIRYASGASQAKYLREYRPELCSTLNDGQASTLFESVYTGEFRAEYLRTVFPGLSQDVLEQVAEVRLSDLVPMQYNSPQ